jgi:putative membrane protein
MNPTGALIHWDVQPTVVLGVGITAVLYELGVRYSRLHGLAKHHQWWNTLSFYLGMLAVLVAVGGPLDAAADTLFWMHMIQHELLMLVAAPLIVFGQPWLVIWRGIPLGGRRAILGQAFRWGWPLRALRALGHGIFNPRLAWALYVGVFLMWHLPALYDLALENVPIHVLEHLLFLVTAVLFWSQIVPSWPLRRSLGYIAQAVYLITSAMVMNGLAAVYMFSTGPIYPYYAALNRPSGGLTVLEDQHLAGAAMDVPGTILIFCIVVTVLWLWLRDDERAAASPEEQRALLKG